MSKKENPEEIKTTVMGTPDEPKEKLVMTEAFWQRSIIVALAVFLIMAIATWRFTEKAYEKGYEAGVATCDGTATAPTE